MDHPQVGNQSLCNLIACTEINSFLCLKYFLNKDQDFMFLGLRLAYSIIHNRFLGSSSDRENLEVLRNKKRIHNLETEPSHINKWRG